MSTSPMEIRDRPSPNHDARPSGCVIDMLILHYTGMASAAVALDRLLDPAAKVSAHYFVDEDGTVSRLVDESRRAWHAGVASWQRRHDINAVSIGIEIVNPGHEHGYRPFPPAQMRSVKALCQDILGRHPVPPRHVLGHSDVAPERRTDPGEFFDWAELAEAGIGVWPNENVVVGEMGLTLRAGDSGSAVAAIQRGLADIGYAVPISGGIDARTEAVVRAFQRHFRGARVDGVIDPETAQLVFRVAELVR